jgi:hypothetical protein
MLDKKNSNPNPQLEQPPCLGSFLGASFHSEAFVFPVSPSSEVYFQRKKKEFQPSLHTKTKTSKGVKKEGLPLKEQNAKGKRKKYKGKKSSKKNESYVDNWVAMENVVRWLKRNHLFLEEKKEYRNSYEREHNYIYMGKRLNATQVLYLANKLRLEKRKEPFLVDSITF